MVSDLKNGFEHSMQNKQDLKEQLNQNVEMLEQKQKEYFEEIDMMKK